MGLKLPIEIATKQDLARVIRELRIFTDLVMQSVMRHDNPVRYPPISDKLRAIAHENQIDIRGEIACKNLLSQLDELKKHAPTVHISFCTEPPEEAIKKIIAWFRQAVGPKVLIQVGLQPTIAVGMILRTPNKQFDFTLRRHLYNNREKLREALTK